MASWDAHIKDELRLVEEEIARSVGSRQPILKEIAMHVIQGGGKRLRPGVAILSFRAVGGEDIESVIKVSAGVELIHSATLIHDDINDGSDTRRGRIAAYKKYGIQKAIITGDFLFVQGFRLGASHNNREIVEMVGDACTAMAESEILQLDVERDSDLPLETYMRIIDGKTARPIMASAMVGAFFGKGSADQIDALGKYGLNIGYAFQIVDDILDIDGQEASIGKPLGMDILDSKANLPLMIAMHRGGKGSERIKEIFNAPRKTWEEIDEALALVRSSGAVDEARKNAADFRDKALSALHDIAPSKYHDSLRELASTVLERSN